jgi:hypothetical protein
VKENSIKFSFFFRSISFIASFFKGIKENLEKVGKAKVGLINRFDPNKTSQVLM